MCSITCQKKERKEEWTWKKYCVGSTDLKNTENKSSNIRNLFKRC